MPAYKNVELKVALGIEGAYGIILVSDNSEELYRTPMHETEKQAMDDIWFKWQEIKSTRAV